MITEKKIAKEIPDDTVRLVKFLKFLYIMLVMPKREMMKASKEEKNKTKELHT